MGGEVLDTGKMDASMDSLRGMLNESISAMDSAGKWVETNVGREFESVRRIPLSGMPPRAAAGQSDALAKAKAEADAAAEARRKAVLLASFMSVVQDSSEDEDEDEDDGGEDEDEAEARRKRNLRNAAMV